MRRTVWQIQMRPRPRSGICTLEKSSIVAETACPRVPQESNDKRKSLAIIPWFKCQPASSTFLQRARGRIGHVETSAVGNIVALIAYSQGFPSLLAQSPLLL